MHTTSEASSLSLCSWFYLRKEDPSDLLSEVREIWRISRIVKERSDWICSLLWALSLTPTTQLLTSTWMRPSRTAERHMKATPPQVATGIHSCYLLYWISFNVIQITLRRFLPKVLRKQNRRKTGTLRPSDQKRYRTSCWMKASFQTSSHVIPTNKEQYRFPVQYCQAGVRLSTWILECLLSGARLMKTHDNLHSFVGREFTKEPEPTPVHHTWPYPIVLHVIRTCIEHFVQDNSEYRLVGELPDVIYRAYLNPRSTI